MKQARKLLATLVRNYDLLTRSLAHSLTGVKCRATSVAKKNTYEKEKGRGVLIMGRYIKNMIVSYQFSKSRTTQYQGLKTHIFANLTFLKVQTTWFTYFHTKYYVQWNHERKIPSEIEVPLAPEST